MLWTHAEVMMGSIAIRSLSPTGWFVCCRRNCGLISVGEQSLSPTEGFMARVSICGRYPPFSSPRSLTSTLARSTSVSCFAYVNNGLPSTFFTDDPTIILLDMSAWWTLLLFFGPCPILIVFQTGNPASVILFPSSVLFGELLSGRQNTLSASIVKTTVSHNIFRAILFRWKPKPPNDSFLNTSR